MKIELIGKPKIIMSNPNSHHAYFAWPTAKRLQDGKIAVGASGFRLEHVCPFGKSVISYSYDNGETYTFPAPVIDTPLDDRDAGLCTFGEKGLIITSFNNSAEMQREYNQDNSFVEKYVYAKPNNAGWFSGVEYYDSNEKYIKGDYYFDSEFSNLRFSQYREYNDNNSFFDKFTFYTDKPLHFRLCCAKNINFARKRLLQSARMFVIIEVSEVVEGDLCLCCFPTMWRFMPCPMCLSALFCGCSPLSPLCAAVTLSCRESETPSFPWFWQFWTALC